MAEEERLRLENDALRAENTRLHAELAALRRENAESGAVHQGESQASRTSLRLLATRLSGEIAADFEIGGLNIAVQDVKRRIATCEGVSESCLSLTTSSGEIVREGSRPTTLADTVGLVPVNGCVQLGLVVRAPAWHASSHLSLSNAATVATRTTGTDGKWVIIQYSANVLATPGTSSYQIEILDDPSDGCWMIGFMSASVHVKSTIADSHANRHPDYKHMLMYRSDRGDVWMDEQKRGGRVEACGNSTGKVVTVTLTLFEDAATLAKMEISGASPSGRPISIEANLPFSSTCDAMRFAILTYRVNSSFRLIECSAS